MDRRQLLALFGASAALMACGGIGWASPGDDKAEARGGGSRKDAVDLSPAEWKKHLTPVEFNILREAGTERAFTGDLWDHKGDGVYVCAGCGLPLFDSETKYKSGTGWPSFWKPIAKDRVGDKVDAKFGMIRTENVCARCGGHLGHVFTDGPQPTGLRYCMNSFAMDFVPRDQVAKLEGEPVKLGGFDVSKKAGKDTTTDKGGL